MSGNQERADGNIRKIAPIKEKPTISENATNASSPALQGNVHRLYEAFPVYKSAQTTPFLPADSNSRLIEEPEQEVKREPNKFMTLREKGLLEGKRPIAYSERHHPILTREQERLIFKKIQAGETVDELIQDPAFLTMLEATPDKEKPKWGQMLATADTLTDLITNCNHRIVVKKAFEFRNRVFGQKIPLEDLVQAGKEGLLRSIGKFDPEKGYRFFSYAGPFVTGSFHKETRRQLGVGTHTYYVMNKGLELSYAYSQLYGKKPTPEALADILLFATTSRQASSKDIDRAVSVLYSPRMRSLNEKVTPDEARSKELGDDVTSNVIDVTETFHAREQRAKVQSAINITLTQEERRIVIALFNMNEKGARSAQELAQEQGVTEQDIAVTLAIALRKLHDSTELQEEKTQRVGAASVEQVLVSPLPSETADHETGQTEEASALLFNTLEQQIKKLQEAAKGRNESLSWNQALSRRRDLVDTEKAEAVMHWVQKDRQENKDKPVPLKKNSYAFSTEDIVDLLYGATYEQLAQKHNISKKRISEEVTKEQQDYVAIIRDGIATGTIETTRILEGFDPSLIDTLNPAQRALAEALVTPRPEKTTHEELAQALGLRKKQIDIRLYQLTRKLQLNNKIHLAAVLLALQQEKIDQKAQGKFTRLREQGLLRDEELPQIREKDHPILTREQELLIFQKIKSGESIDSLIYDPTFLATITSLPDEEKPKWGIILATADTLSDVITTCNHRMVVQQALGFHKTVLGSQIKFDELIQAGKLGILHAITKFDHERGNRFYTYAVPWVVKSFQTETQNQLELDSPKTYFAINKGLQLLFAYSQLYGKNATPEELADLLLYTTKPKHVPFPTIDRAVSFLFSPRIRFLNEKVHKLDSQSNELIDLIEHNLVDVQDVVQAKAERETVHKAIDINLTPEEKAVVKGFFAMDDTPSEVNQEIDEQDFATLIDALSKLRTSDTLKGFKKERLGAPPVTEIIHSSDNKSETESKPTKEAHHLVWNTLEQQIKKLQEAAKNEGKIRSLNDIKRERRTAAETDMTKAVFEWIQQDTSKHSYTTTTGRSRDKQKLLAQVRKKFEDGDFFRPPPPVSSPKEVSVGTPANTPEKNLKPWRQPPQEFRPPKESSTAETKTRPRQREEDESEQKTKQEIIMDLAQGVTQEQITKNRKVKLYSVTKLILINGGDVIVLMRNAHAAGSIDYNIIFAGIDPNRFASLTTKEIEIAESLITPRTMKSSDKQLAQDLSLPETRIRKGLKNVMQKLQLNNRAQVAAVFLGLNEDNKALDKKTTAPLSTEITELREKIREIIAEVRAKPTVVRSSPSELAARRDQVAAMLQQSNYTAQEIATELGISEQTAKDDLSALRKQGVIGPRRTGPKPSPTTIARRESIRQRLQQDPDLSPLTLAKEHGVKTAVIKKDIIALEKSDEYTQKTERLPQSADVFDSNFVR